MNRTAGAALGVALLLGSGAARAVQTRFWEVQGPADFLAGKLDGVALEEDGSLILSPDLLAIAMEEGASPQPFLWDLALDREGNLYVGSGTRGIVYRIDPRGDATTFFTAPEAQVHALAVDSEGRLLVGASPPGRVYRLEPDGDAALLLETGERFLWDLAVGRGDLLYIATGERGMLFTVDPEGETEVLFDADEPHLVSLALDLDGSLLVGSAGSGLLYEIGPDGRARVRMAADGEEVVAVELLPDGTAYAAVNQVVPPEEEKEEDEGEPKERLAGELPRGPAPAPAGLEELAGEEEEVSLGPEARREVLRLRSRLYHLPPGGPPTPVWESDTDGIHALRAAAPARIYFGTGVPGGLYQLDRGGRPKLLNRFAESQVTAIDVGTGGQLYAVTSNEGRLYRATGEFGGSGSYRSSILDAGGEARWGRVAWDADAPAGSRVEIATRSGNSPRPDATWSGWSPAYARSAGTPVSSPPARYLQFRARLSRLGDAATPRLDSVHVSYRQENRPPRVADLSLAPDPESAPGDGPATKRRVTWSAEDPDGDRLSHALYLRRYGETDWRELGITVSDPETVWDTSGLEGGRYRLEVRTSDEPDNGIDTARVARAQSPPFLVDHAPPEIEILSSSGEGGTARISLRVVDEVSPVVRVDYAVDRGPGRRRLQAEDGLDDGLEERYELRAEGLEPGRRSLEIAATDRAGNRRTVTVPVEVQR